MTDTITAHKSTFRRWMEKIAGDAGMTTQKSHAKEVALTLRQVGEGGVVGSVLGAVDAEVGLDVKGVPLDLVLTAAGTAGAIALATEEYAHDLRNAGSSAFTVFTYRKTKELLRKKSGIGLEDSGSRQPGDESDVGEEDPVVQAAREL